MKLASQVIWLTGLSGAGKTTIAKELALTICSEYPGTKVECLDGDIIRDLVDIGFSKQERINHIKYMGLLAKHLEIHGCVVIASFISPYEESRDFVRDICRNFLEVYISTPLEECKSRDVKGLYAKQAKGEIKGLTGIDAPYEVPTNAIEIDTTNLTVREGVWKIFNILKK